MVVFFNVVYFVVVWWWSHLLCDLVLKRGRVWIVKVPFADGESMCRLGQVDDFNLHETRLKPTKEQFGKDRVAWVKPTEGVEQYADGFFK